MNIEVEIWKDVPGYEGLYQCSNLGRIKSLPKKMGNGYSKLKYKKLTLNRHGYYYCNLWKNNKPETIQLHQIVAITFLGHSRSKMKMVVDHIDNNKENNNINNLQLITQRENVSKDKKNKYSVHTGIRINFNKWVAQIKINYKTICLGYFDTEIEAHNAYQNKIKELNNG